MVWEDNRTMNDLAHTYYSARDRNQLAEGIWTMVAQISCRLTPDPDIAGDYRLHIYEKLEHCMKIYETRRGTPFRAFLVHYLRNEYKNFRRLKARRTSVEIMYQQPTWLVDEQSIRISSSPLHSQTNSRYNSFHRALRELSDKHRIVLKLYGGMELNLKELRLFIQSTGCSHRAAQFLLDKRSRNEKSKKRWNTQGEKAAYLYPINKTSPVKHPHIDLQKQASLIQAHTTSSKHCEVSRISRLLGVNRSTVSRHLHEAARHLDSRVNFFEKQYAV